MIFGSHDPKTLAQLADVATRAHRVALMADGHLGYIMPIGGVAAYHNQVSVVGVGFDIACGNAAIMTDRTVADFTPESLAQSAAAWSAVPGRSQQDSLRAKARNQLGTVGSGNHYVDVFADEQGRVWVGVHFGSRGLGHTVAGFSRSRRMRRGATRCACCIRSRRWSS